jgi:peptidyl-prolyl cis-trans isomerase SurA
MMNPKVSQSYRGGVVIMALLLTLTGLWGAGMTAVHAEMVDRIIASVNDDIIMLSDLNMLMKPYVHQIKAAGYPLSKERETLFKLRAELLGKLIESKLADQQAALQKIEVSEEDVDHTLNAFLDARGISAEQFQKQLRDTGMELSEYRQTIREQIMRSRLVNRKFNSRVVVTREDVERYYREHPEEFAGEKKYHLRNIIMPFAGANSRKELGKIRAEMDAVHQQLMQGAEFVAMVRQHSRSKNAANGGDLGILAAEVLAPRIRDAIKGLSAGQFSPIVETGQGLQIFYVEEVIGSPGKSLEDSVAQIEDTLQKKIVNERYRTWMEELKQRSYIEILE